MTKIPGYKETTNLFPETPDDYPQGEDDFDENVYPGVKHVRRSKLGGWPSWVHDPHPPLTADHERLKFIAQLDTPLSEPAAWCGGGYAYLFLISGSQGTYRGEMVLQPT